MQRWKTYDATQVKIHPGSSLIVIKERESASPTTLYGTDTRFSSLQAKLQRWQQEQHEGFKSVNYSTYESNNNIPLYISVKKLVKKTLVYWKYVRFSPKENHQIAEGKIIQTTLKNFLGKLGLGAAVKLCQAGISKVTSDLELTPRETFSICF